MMGISREEIAGSSTSGAANGHDQVMKEEQLKADDWRARLIPDRRVDDGNSVLLHLSVKCNHLDVSSLVLDSTGDDGEAEARKMINSLGDTIIHLAVMLQRAETVRFPPELSPRVKTEVINTAKEKEFTALDVQNHFLEDNKTLQESSEIQGGEAEAENNVRPSHPTPGADDGQRKLGEDGAVEEVPAKAQDQLVFPKYSRKTCRKWVWLRVKWLMDYRGDWMNETRGSLMTVSSIIATVTFAAAISPPGGVWQQDTRESAVTYPCEVNKSCPICSKDNVCVAGSAVLAYYDPYDFTLFMKYNMTSFITSLMVLFLLMSGFPLNNKFCLWLLSLAMCLTISFLGLTFLQGLGLMIPHRAFGPGSVPDSQFDNEMMVAIKVWFGMVSVTGLCLTVRLSSWLVRIYKSTWFKSAGRRLLGFYTGCLSKLLP